MQVIAKKYVKWSDALVDNILILENEINELLQDKHNFVEITGNIIFSNKVLQGERLIEKSNDITNEGVVLLSQYDGMRKIKYQGILPSKETIKEISSFNYNIPFKKDEYDKYLSITSKNINYLCIAENKVFEAELHNYIENYANIKNYIIDVKKYISYYFNSSNTRILQQSCLITGSSWLGNILKRRNIFTRSLQEFYAALSFDSLKQEKEMSFPLIQFEKKRYVLLLSPHSASIVFHEICHLFEYGKDCILPGTKLSSYLLNVYMSPKSEDSYVNFTYDDEGVCSEKIQLIKDGILVNNIHSKMTSLSFDNIPCGYGRRAFFDSSIVPRMANIVVEPNINVVDNVFGLVKEGLYIDQCQSGLTNIKNKYTRLNGINLYRIKNGEITTQYNLSSLQFNLIDFLQNIVYIGSKNCVSNGLCTGGLPVSYSSPFILSAEIEVQ